VVVLDVGQGDAIALALGGTWWLVDAGPRTPRFDAGQSVVLPFFRWAAVRRLNTLVLTHDDSDHIGGAAAVLRELAVARTLAPAPRTGVPGPLARFPGAPVRIGAMLCTSPPVLVRWPPPPDSATSFWEHPVTSADNGAVAVLELGRDAGRTLLAADADSAVERALDVQEGVALLKVAHHGSGSSSGAQFLARVRPRIAALSVGRNNRFGHPDPLALARLVASGARVMRTDESGTLWFEVSGAGASALDWRRGAWRASAESPRLERPRPPSP
jgi:competence protein ComEC